MQTFFTSTLPRFSLILSPILFIALGGYGYYYVQSQKVQYLEIQEELETQKELAVNTTKSLTESIQLIERNLLEKNSQLSQNISNEQELIALIAQDLQKITGTVGTLDKLRRMDPELLQKYSKVYFLNEHYIPSSVSPIPEEFLYLKEKPQTFQSDALPHLVALLTDAKNAGIVLQVSSGYRSFYEQANLKTAYSVIYGTGTANKFSADQGYSEHQLGTTVDFITTGVNSTLLGFDTKPAYKWLQENAHKYGFTLSYPKNNSYYIYEPWHWRYVGVSLATRLYNEGKNFYDTDQRIIDEYLPVFFD